MPAHPATLTLFASSLPVPRLPIPKKLPIPAATATLNEDMEANPPKEPGFNLNWVGPEKGDTPLHRACRFEHLGVVEFLLQQPAV